MRTNFFHIHGIGLKYFSGCGSCKCVMFSMFNWKKYIYLWVGLQIAGSPGISDDKLLLRKYLCNVLNYLGYLTQIVSGVRCNSLKYQRNHTFSFCILQQEDVWIEHDWGTAWKRHHLEWGDHHHHGGYQHHQPDHHHIHDVPGEQDNAWRRRY